MRNKMTCYQYEFLWAFLRCHFAGKPGVASQNVGCFVRLIFNWTLWRAPIDAWSNTTFSFWFIRMCTWQTVKRICHFIRRKLMLYSTYPFTAMLQEYVVNCCARFLCFVLLSGQNIPSIRKIKANSSSFTEPDVGQAVWLLGEIKILYKLNFTEIKLLL